MALGNTKEFHRFFSAARQISRKIPPATRSVDQKDNLIINGGFEKGLVLPWGTGHYERPDGKFRFGIWWNSMNAKAFMKIDTNMKHSGRNSLRITNYSSSAPHVFTTLSQRIKPAVPNSLYEISCYIKAENLKPGAVNFALDAAWTIRTGNLPGGTYDWKLFKDTVNTGHNNYIDLRILHVNTGTIWIDDIKVRRIDDFDKMRPIEKAEKLFNMGDYEKAIAIIKNLEKKYEKEKGRLFKIKRLAGKIHMILGQYSTATQEFNWLIDNGYSIAVMDMGDVYYRLGDYETATGYFKKALKIVADDQGTKSLVMNRLSRCYLGTGDFDNALDAQKKSFRILKHIEDKHGQALSLFQAGTILFRKKDFKSAQNQFFMAFDIAKNLGDKKLVSDIFSRLASTYLKTGNIEKADEYVNKSIDIKNKINDKLGIVRALHIKARISASKGDLNQACDYYKRAIAIFEKLASYAGEISREAKESFLKRFSELFREYTDILFRLYEKTKNKNFYEQAFTVTEQARSRIFTEMMTEARALESFAATSHDPGFVSLIKKEKLLGLKIHGLKKRLEKNKKNVPEIDKKLDRARSELLKIRRTLTEKYPRYSDLKQPKPLILTRIADILKPDEGVISFFVTKNRTGLWAITKEKTGFSLINVPREKLINESEAFRKVFSGIADKLARFDPVFGKRRLKKSFMKYDTKAGYHLYKTLIAPVISIIKSKGVIYIAPDDLLYKLPFETLLTKPFTTEKQEKILCASFKNAPFLIKTHAISYLPSVSVLRSLRTFTKKNAPKPEEPLIAFADPVFGTEKSQNGQSSTRSPAILSLRSATGLSVLPPLPDTREEAINVAKILGAPVEKSVYLKERANEYNVKNLPLYKYKTLLFATHGLMAGEFGPGVQPSLALSFVGDKTNDGLLEMGEILGLNINAGLVVLSACNTAAGTGKNDRGEGFAGLTRSFMYAGAKSLLVTLWSVETRSAKELVQKIFASKKDNPAEMALTYAKRGFINSGKALDFGPGLSVSLSHPFFWAPYILVGEGRSIDFIQRRLLFDDKPPISNTEAE